MLDLAVVDLPEVPEPVAVDGCGALHPSDFSRRVFEKKESFCVVY